MAEEAQGGRARRALVATEQVLDPQGPGPARVLTPHLVAAEAEAAAALSAHLVQPSAYTIPPQKEETLPVEESHERSLNNSPRNFPASIPRAQTPTPPVIAIESESEMIEEIDSPEPVEEENIPEFEKVDEPVRIRRPRVRQETPAWMRQFAKIIAGGIQATRKVSANIGERARNFLPRLLPGAEIPAETNGPSTCLLYTSDAADERSSVDLGGRRIIKKKKEQTPTVGRTRKKKKNKVRNNE